MAMVKVQHTIVEKDLSATEAAKLRDKLNNKKCELCNEILDTTQGTHCLPCIHQ